LRPGNLPKGKAAVNLNWDLEILPKGKAAASFYWDLEIFLPKGKAAVSFYWDLEILPKGKAAVKTCSQLLLGPGNLTKRVHFFGRLHSSYLLLSHSRCKCD
jgi:hypothetical protein